jgi:hypothetical protein
VVRGPARIDSPPVRQTVQLEVAYAEFLARQKALPLAAVRAIASLPPECFGGLELFLVNNVAYGVNDGWLRLSGHKAQGAIVFFELVATPVRRWFRKPVVRVALAANLPPGSLNDVIALLRDGSGLDGFEKQRDGRDALLVFAAELGRPVISHAPGSRLVFR